MIPLVNLVTELESLRIIASNWLILLREQYVIKRKLTTIDDNYGCLCTSNTKGIFVF